MKKIDTFLNNIFSNDKIRQNLAKMQFKTWDNLSFNERVTLFKDIVDEISQDAMIALAANINEINDEAHLKRFVKRVTHNKCIDYIRKNKELFHAVAVAPAPYEAC